tara:strand:- start:605 stop:778 length:174 start_codon:yes stop_codon:yes gene_type:complete
MRKINRITKWCQAVPILLEFMENQDLPQEVEESWEMVTESLRALEQYSIEWEANNAE